MPWNDNSSPGGKPDRKPGPKPGPWGAPPSGGGGGNGGGTGGGGGSRGPNRPPPRRPKDLNDLGRDLSRRFGDAFGGGIKPTTVAIVAGAIVGLWALSGVYIVQPAEQAVITTFGAYSGWQGSGMHYHLPAPIQKVQKVLVTTVRKTDIGGQAGADAPDEGLMLTADENIVDLDFTVQWKVSKASDFLFNVKDPDAAVKAVAESAMREVIGKTNLQPILTESRGQVQSETRALMQQTLNRYRAGILIDEVLIRNAGPPAPVVDAFRAYTAAEQDAKTYQNQAGADAAKIVNDAKGYAAQARLEAEGDAARFNSVYAQYKLAPQVTRDRLYIETMQRVLARANKVVIDSKGASAPIILPPDVFRPRSQQAGPNSQTDTRAGGSR